VQAPVLEVAPESAVVLPIDGPADLVLRGGKIVTDDD
jgi:hypothetical protein